MGEPLKYMYNSQFFEHLCPVIKEVVPDFGERRFVYSVFDKTWPDLELKQRTRQVTKALGECLPSDYPKAIEMVVNICRLLQNRKGTLLPTYPLIFLPDYVEQYGMDHFELSMHAIEESTKLVSAEFAIRPFIAKYPSETMAMMLKWSKNSHVAVRRLSSEGCRPRLPWGMGLPFLKKDPSPILPILENLKTDPSESVRRSVANNLNDIAKDHPEIALRISQQWKSTGSETDWIIKHGCRTLLKRGNAKVLTLHGFNPKARGRIKNLKISEKVRIGESLNFQFEFMNSEKSSTRYRIDYIIDYLTRSGNISTKIFKLTEYRFEPGQQLLFKRKKSFANFSTRIHFKGHHQLRIMANGVELAARKFIVH
jgi:3-methyladenine DNA glycosylase AlkC